MIRASQILRMKYQKALYKTIRSYNDLINDEKELTKWLSYGTTFLNCRFCSVNIEHLQQTNEYIYTPNCWKCPLNKKAITIDIDNEENDLPCTNGTFRKFKDAIKNEKEFSKIRKHAINRLEWIKKTSIKTGYKIE